MQITVIQSKGGKTIGLILWKERELRKYYQLGENHECYKEEVSLEGCLGNPKKADEKYTWRTCLGDVPSLEKAQCT